jgi:hypothetical protein
MSKNCGCMKRTMKFGVKCGNAKINLNSGCASISGDELEFVGKTNGDSDIESIYNSDCEEAVNSDCESDCESDKAPTSDKAPKKRRGSDQSMTDVAKGIMSEVARNVAVSTLTGFLI